MWERQPDWMQDAVRVRVLTRHRQGTGVRIAVRTRVLGLPLLTETLEVVEWDQPHRLRVAHRGFVRGVGEWVLEDLDEATRLRWNESLGLPIARLGELALRAYRPFLRRLMGRSLAKFALAMT
jgi:hypothetical protein